VSFITFCTRDRATIQNLRPVYDAFSRYSERANEHNVAVGRYVLMPDHIHLFVKGDANFVFSRWIGGMKRASQSRSAVILVSFGNPVFSITFFVPTRVTTKNGIT
jgi:REP element-mobilizing transposase RayT